MAIRKVYGTYRYKWTNDGTRYTPGYFLNKQFKDYFDAGLTKILDTEIPEERYIAEIIPGVKKMSRFVIGEYEDSIINPIAFADSITKVGAEFAVKMFANPAEAIVRLKNNTDLKLLNEKLDTNGNPIYAEFEIYPARKDETTGEQIPAKILVID